MGQLIWCGVVWPGPGNLYAYDAGMDFALSTDTGWTRMARAMMTSLRSTCRMTPRAPFTKPRCRSTLHVRPTLTPTENTSFVPPAASSPVTESCLEELHVEAGRVEGRSLTAGGRQEHERFAASRFQLQRCTRGRRGLRGHDPLYEELFDSCLRQLCATDCGQELQEHGVARAGVRMLLQLHVPKSACVDVAYVGISQRCRVRRRLELILVAKKMGGGCLIAEGDLLDDGVEAQVPLGRGVPRDDADRGPPARTTAGLGLYSDQGFGCSDSCRSDQAGRVILPLLRRRGT